ncbi:MAG: AAA family ATPase, partial [Solirubrobacterales bacterium]
MVESVRVLDLRNLAACEVELAPGLNLVWGPNGAGKTNLLEATYMALTGRSCRTRDDREAIAFGKPLARAEAGVLAQGQRRSFLCAISRSEGRRHLLDGAPAGPESASLRPALAVFMPDRLALVKGPPAGRRAHLDGFCAALWPSRTETRRRYSRALAQRNALLGRIRAGAAEPGSLDAWDRELASSGLELIADRREAIELLAPAFEQAAAGLGLAADASLRYRPR